MNSSIKLIIALSAELYYLMRIARVTLEDVIARNYQNISNLDFDIKNLVQHLQSESKPDINIFRRGKSHKTIEDSNNYSPPKLTKKLSYEMVRAVSHQSQNKHKRKGSFVYKDIKPKEDVERASLSPRKKIGNYIDSKKLHRFLFEMELPVVNPQDRPRKTKFTIIPSTAPAMYKPESVKLIKKYENQELPAFLKRHLENNHPTKIEPDLVRKAMSMMKIKRRNRGASMCPVKYGVDIVDDKGIRPDVTELRAIDLRSRNQRKIKTSQNLIHRKIKTSTRRFQENALGQICGWDVQQ